MSRSTHGVAASATMAFLASLLVLLPASASQAATHHLRPTRGITVSTATPVAGSVFTISGRTPYHHRGHVRLELRRSGHWMRIARLRAADHGWFTFAVRARPAGKHYRYRVMRAGFLVGEGTVTPQRAPQAPSPTPAPVVAPVVTTDTLNDAWASLRYGTLVQVDVTDAGHWDAQGDLPPGLTLSDSTDPGYNDGILGGTPTTPGTYTFQVRFTDLVTGGVSDWHNVTLTVAPAPPAPVVTTDALDDATVGTFYDRGLSVSDPNQGGWQVRGDFPTWLTVDDNEVNNNDLLISGTPPADATGSHTFQVRFTVGWSGLTSAWHTLTINVVPAGS